MNEPKGRRRQLAELAPGDRAVVAEYAGEGPALLRLQEMGVLPGTPVRFLRRAPLGDPLEIEVRGYCLSLRMSEARAITVQ